LTGIAWRKSDSTLLGDLSYGYDDAGQIVAQGGSFALQDLPTAVTDTAFDDNNRQTRFNGQNLTYDANGNLLSDGQRTYIWNVRDQLEQIKQGANVVASFSYDPMDRRVSKTENGQTVTYLYDGYNPVQEKHGATVIPVLTGLDIDQYYARTEPNGTRSYFLTDHLDSTRALTDGNGNIIQRYDYTPYGQTYANAAGSTNPYQYTGRELDQSGLYYYRARYYSPQMGRFISEDPIEFDSGDINFYSYVFNNPIMLIDPDGLAGRKGERGRTKSPGGTNNPSKHWREDPNRPGWGWQRDANGKEHYKKRPPYITPRNQGGWVSLRLLMCTNAVGLGVYLLTYSPGLGGECIDGCCSDMRCGPMDNIGKDE
jgi:RHS repeat-associated protein